MPTIGQMRSTGWYDTQGKPTKPRGDLWWFTADDEQHVYDWSDGSAHCDTRIRYRGTNTELASRRAIPRDACERCRATVEGADMAAGLLTVKPAELAALLGMRLRGQ